MTAGTYVQGSWHERRARRATQCGAIIPSTLEAKALPGSALVQALE
jgi:hypothetical protein